MIDLPDNVYNAMKLAPDMIDWSKVLIKYNLNDFQLNEFLEEITNYVDAEEYEGRFFLYSFQKLSINFIKQHIDYVTRYCWDILSTNKNISEEIIDEYIDNINWDYLSSQREMDINFIRKYSHKIDFTLVLNNYKIPKAIKDYCRMFL
jgi:hypothetical protein